MESCVPLTANQDLNAVSVSPRTVIFNQSIWNYLVSTSEVICLIDSPAFPQRKVTLLKQPTLLETSFFCPLLAIKAFHLIQLLGAPFYPLDGMLSNSSIDE